jgi:hypothetical protein
MADPLLPPVFQAVYQVWDHPGIRVIEHGGGLFHLAPAVKQAVCLVFSAVVEIGKG